MQHATQAWRQSEAAVWETITPDIRARSLLLLTRFDKLTNELDRERVLRRVRGETRGLFAGVYPISLLQALGAGEDREIWTASGAEDFLGAFVNLLHELGAKLGTDFSTPAAAAVGTDAHAQAGQRIANAVSGAPAHDPDPGAETGIAPRRVARPVRPDRDRRPRPPAAG